MSNSWLRCMQAQCCATAVTSAATLHWSITELCRCCGAACAMLSMLGHAVPACCDMLCHRSLASAPRASAIGRRGAAWSRLSAGLDSRLTVALSDQRDQRGSMQRLSIAVTDVVHVQLLSALHASSVLCDCSDQRGDSALVDHGAVPVFRRCLRDAQHVVTCCDSV